MNIRNFHLILVILSEFTCLWAILDENLIVDYFAAKFCTMGAVFSCSSKKEQVKIAKYLILSGLRISFFDVANLTTSAAVNLTKDHNRLAVILDADCNNIEPFLQECGESKFFYDTYHWLAFGAAHNVIEKFKNVALTISTDLNVAIPNGEDENGKITNWTIVDVYNPGYYHKGQLKIEDIGYYNEKDGYELKTKDVKYFRRRNMTGTLFNTAMVIPENISMPLEEYMAREDERYNNTFTRFQSVTVINCADFFNFTMNVSLLQSWGYEQPNGEVDGMVKGLRDKSLDFGLAPLMFKLYRLKVMDFGYGNWIMKSIFVFRHPKSTATSYELYLRPLETSIWISTILILIIMVVILRFTATKEIEVLGSAVEGGDSSWSFIILYGVGEICQQGFSYIPVLPSGRIVIFIILLFSFLIYQFYSASLVSFLLLEPKRTILNLLDLLKSPLKVGVEDSLFDRDYLAKTTDPVTIRLYKTKIKGPRNTSHFLLPYEGLKKVEYGGYAFHTQTSTAYPIIERTFMEKAICELAEVQMYPTQYMYMSIQKHSPFKGMFDYCMAHQREVGVIDRLQQYWDTPKPICLNRINYFEITIGLNESYWALLVLGLGVLTSLGLLTVEQIWAKKKDAIKEKYFRRKKMTLVEPFVN